jgi:hypothetical protein
MTAASAVSMNAAATRTSMLVRMMRDTASAVQADLMRRIAGKDSS